jgi:hypothetical protein
MESFILRSYSRSDILHTLHATRHNEETNNETWSISPQASFYVAFLLPPLVRDVSVSPIWSHGIASLQLPLLLGCRSEENFSCLLLETEDDNQLG